MLESKINRIYETHDCQRICQGDIFRDFKFFIIDRDNNQVEISFTYIIVISQDCDLQQGSKIKEIEPFDIKEFNQYLPNVLFVPAFPSESIRQGEHFKELFKIKPQKINSDGWKNIKNNSNPRYHYLPEDIDLQLPELVIDFKAYYTLPFETLSENCKNYYLVTVNELFRESLSQRFSYYLNRIGLPEIPKKI